MTVGTHTYVHIQRKIGFFFCGISYCNHSKPKNYAPPPAWCARKCRASAAATAASEATNVAINSLSDKMGGGMCAIDDGAGAAVHISSVAASSATASCLCQYRRR